MNASAASGSFAQPLLPWSTAAPQERRFRHILLAAMAAALAAVTVLHQLPPGLPDPSPAEPPLPTARLLPPRQAPMPLRPVQPPKAAPAAVEAVAAAAPVRGEGAVPTPLSQVPRAAALTAEAAVAQARRNIAGVGLLAMSSELAALSAAPLAASLRQDLAATRGVSASVDAGAPARALVAEMAGRGSTTLASPGLAHEGSASGPARAGPASGLAGRATTRVDSATGGGGSAGPGIATRAAARPTRSIEDVKLVFERHKAALHAIYTRALRDDPALQGKLVLELKITPAGQVAEARVVSSELRSEALESKLLARIRQIDFGARDADPLMLSWPLDFLPS